MVQKIYIDKSGDYIIYYLIRDSFQSYRGVISNCDGIRYRLYRGILLKEFQRGKSKFFKMDILRVILVVRVYICLAEYYVGLWLEGIVQYSCQIGQVFFFIVFVFQFVFLKYVEYIF